MSERKVLNKYYPPDFDPSKIPKLRLAKERQYTVRIMAPFNMQCKMCNEYIYKGKKFNAKTENVHNENYLGLRIYRFYIRCPRCISEVVFKTDPENTDYTLEQGATRLFEAAKLLQAAEEKEKKQTEEDAQNPMKVLENRTRDSKLEMEVMENLEELRELNMRQAALNHEDILRQGAELQAQQLRQQELDDEEEIRRLFGKTAEDGIIIKRLADEEEEEEAEEEVSPFSTPSTSQPPSLKRPTDVLTDDSPDPSAYPKKQKTSENFLRPLAKASSKASSKSFLSSLVKVKKGSSSSKDGSSSSSSENIKPGLASTDTSTSSEIAHSLTATQGTASNADATTPISTGGATETPVDSMERGEGVIERKQEGGKSKEEEKEEEEGNNFASSIQEGLLKQKASGKKTEKEKSSGLSLLGGYDFSDSDLSSSDTD